MLFWGFSYLVLLVASYGILGTAPIWVQTFLESFGVCLHLFIAFSCLLACMAIKKETSSS